MDLIAKVKETINKYDLFNIGDKILVGVSGGADSIALVNILKQLQPEYDLELHIAHVDHMLRGIASSADAEFVNQVGTELGVDVTTEVYDVKSYQQENKLSLEDAARQIRYRFFFTLLEELDFDKLALGHHANDQAETVVMKFLRGAGLQGIGGINPQLESVIRPLIELKKEELKEYCKQNYLQWRTDSTNRVEICLRNKIRLNLLPQLIDEYNPDLIDNLKQMSEIFRTENDYLEAEANRLLAQITIVDSRDKLVVDSIKFNKLHLAMQRRVIREIFKELTGSYQDLYFHNIQEALELIQQGKTGLKTNLPTGVLVKLNYNQLIFMKAKDIEETDFFCYQVQVGEQLRIPELDLIIDSTIIEFDYPWQTELEQANKLFFSFSQIGTTFYIRQRKEGDVFQPLGMSGTKKIKDFFIDEKIPLAKRDKIPVFTTSDHEIFSLGSLRIDDRYKVTDKTTNIIMVEIKDLKED
jgi:tRNA(Ile)-lysidine synthase